MVDEQPIVVMVNNSAQDNLKKPLRVRLCAFLTASHAFNRHIGKHLAMLIPLLPNDAHHWRRGSNDRYVTETESRRPVHEPKPLRGVDDLGRKGVPGVPDSGL
jgi:hypothetical protein